MLLRRLIGLTLRRTRQQQGRTLREVAALARVSVAYLSEVERGRKEASSEVLAAICRALGLRLADLLDEIREELALVEPVLVPGRAPLPRRAALPSRGPAPRDDAVPPERQVRRPGGPPAARCGVRAARRAGRVACRLPTRVLDHAPGRGHAARRARAGQRAGTCARGATEAALLTTWSTNP